MYSVLKSNLGRRILLLVGMSMFLILGALVISGWLAMLDSSERVFHLVTDTSVHQKTIPGRI